MKTASLISTLAALVLALAVPARAGEGEASKDVPNLQQPREGVYTSGQPMEAGMMEMKARGVKTVVNLRQLDEDGARDESAEAKALDMTYHHFPINTQACTAEGMAEKVKHLTEILENKDSYPVYIHCASANRVGALWTAWRVMHEKAELETAIEEGRRIGLKPALEEQVREMMKQAPATNAGKTGNAEAGADKGAK